VPQLTTAIAEAAALAQAQGLDPALVFQTLEENPALNCPYFGLKKKNILGRDYAPAFQLKHMLKDARFMLAEAASNKLELPVTAAAAALMARAERSGYGDKDLSVVHANLTEPLRR